MESAAEFDWKADLRRMAPVWIIVTVTAIVAVLSMKFVSMNYLSNVITLNQSGCDYAALLMERGRMDLRSLREDVAELRIQSRDLTQDSAGILAGDPRVSRAMAEFEEAARLCPSNEEAFRMLSLLYWYDGQPAAAYTALANALVREEKLPVAQLNFEKALEADPQFAGALKGLADLHIQQNRPGEALEIAEANQDSIAQLTGGKNTLGLIYSANGLTQEAEEYLKKGLMESAGERMPLLRLASIFQTSQRFKEGGDFFMEVGESSPAVIAEVFHNAAILYAQGGYLEEEEEALRKVLDMAQNNAAIHFELAVNLHNQGRKQAAADRLRLAMDYSVTVVNQRINNVGFTPGE